MKALFLGRGPFSKTLQRVLAEVFNDDAHLTIVEFGKKEAAALDFVLDRLSEPFDVAFVATPPQAHAKILPELWKRKIPTWIEKPFASSFDEARQLYAIWHGCGCPPCYVDFPHLRHPSAEATLSALKNSTLRSAMAIVGGPGPDRRYMTGLWDWGAHAAAFSYALGFPTWRSPVPAIHKPGRAAANGVITFPKKSSTLAFAVGNNFPTKMVHYTVIFSTPSRDPDHLGEASTYIASWGSDVPEGSDAPLQKAMKEMVQAVVEKVRRPIFTSPNWDLQFALRVTQSLEALGPCQPVT